MPRCCACSSGDGLVPAGRVGQQPQGEVLRDYQSGPTAAGRGNRELAADCRGHRQAVAAAGPVVMGTWLAVWLSRARGLVLSRRLDDEFRREIASHLDALIADHIRRGMTPDEARRTAI